MPGPRASGSISSFLFVSDLYRYKNLHRLLAALAGIDANWHLKVVGWPLEPAYMAQLEEIVNVKGLSNKVDFLGRQKPDAVAALYAESDCLVWPSYGETFGHPLLEARSHGLPVISARAASNAEIAGDAAVYFSTFEVDDLRRVLLDALNHGIVPGELPRSYGWDRCADETAMLLTEVA
jgi:glycosyltransferase involved in cell wall biosynthesis